MLDSVSYIRKDTIGLLTINQPKTRNALDWGMQHRFAEIVAQCANDTTLRALIITGGGATFVAGGNIRDQVDHFDAETGAKLKRTMTAALQTLTEMPIPVFAAINGNAYGGGCELLTACDLRVMSADATLHFVQAKMGLTTGWGGTARLVHLVGASRAMEILLTAQGISAETAHQIGLIHRITHENVLETTLAWAQEIIQLPSNSLGALKQLVWQSETLTAGYAAETEQFVTQWQHPNHSEAVRAFIAKRAPQFDEPDLA